jgi:hypothetical protein
VVLVVGGEFGMPRGNAQSQTGAPSRTWIDSSEINVHGPRDGTNDELKGFALPVWQLFVKLMLSQV